MEFKQPVMLYTASTNVEAHVIVEMLHANGIPAHAVEDQSGVSLWMFGTISQFHQPNVWVDKSTAEKATQLVHRFEEDKRGRENPSVGTGEIHIKCEECGNIDSFTANAQANIDVFIDGDKKITDVRPGQQTLDDVIVTRVWKCNVCGTANKIIDTEEVKNDSARKVSQD